MHSKEEQVEQLLTNARQSLNFLRTVIDDLLLRRDELKHTILEKVLKVQNKYKKHKSVLLNIGSLLLDRRLPLPKNLSDYLAKNLRKRISNIIEDSIELDRLR